MSKIQNYFSKPESRPKIATKRVPIKFIPTMKTSNHQDITPLSRPPTYSLSKIRASRMINSSLDFSSTSSIPQLSMQDTPSSKLFKQYTQSTDSFSERPKEIISLEHRLNSILPDIDPRDKYQEFTGIWGEVNNLFPILFKILSKIKNGVDEYVNYLETSVEDSIKNQKDFQETTHTLKILKKRFQKIALENLDVNNRLVEKDNDYIRMKEKFKSTGKEHRLALAEKEEIINNLSSELKEFTMQLSIANSKIEKYKMSARVLLKIYEEIRDSGKIDSEIYQRLVNMSTHIDEKELIRMHTNSSFEFDRVLEGPYVHTHSKEFSFFSASEMDSLINFNLILK